MIDDLHGMPLAPGFGHVMLPGGAGNFTGAAAARTGYSDFEGVKRRITAEAHKIEGFVVRRPAILDRIIQSSHPLPIGFVSDSD